MTHGVKRIIANGETIVGVQGDIEITPSGMEKEPLVAVDGKVAGFTGEYKAGQAELTTVITELDKFAILKNMEDGELVIELMSGSSFVLTDTTQTANESFKPDEGKIKLTFVGNGKFV